MGDFNIDLLQYESHNNINEFLNTIISHSFLPHILQPTRVTDHSSTFIDNIFSNITDFKTISGNITTLIADHVAQFLLIKKCHVSYKPSSYSVYDYSNFSKEKFIHDFSLIDWSFLSDSSASINYLYKKFHDDTTNFIDNHVPKKKVTKKYLKLRSKPWINTYSQKLMAHRDKLFQHMNKNPTPSNKYLYKKLRSGKVIYFKNYFEQNKTSMKMLWSGIKSIVNVYSKTQLSCISHLTSNGMHVDDPVKMANIFNQYFVNVGSNLDKTIPRTRKSPIDYLKNRNGSSMFLAPVTTQAIELIIQSLNTKKSIGPYCIPVFLLKILSKHISKPLSYLVNLSFPTGIFPDYL